MDSTILLVIGLGVLAVALLVAWLRRASQPAAPAASLGDSLMGDTALTGATAPPLPQVPDLPLLNIPDSIKDSVPDGAQMIFMPPENARMRPVNPDTDPNGLQFIFVPDEDEDGEVLDPDSGWPPPADYPLQMPVPNGHAAAPQQPNDERK